MITSMSLPLTDALSLGCFEPAKVQRQYEWRTSHVTDLLDDLLGAFQRIGADPGEPIVEDDDGDDVEDAAPAEDDADPVPLPAEALVSAPRNLPSRMRPDLYFLGSMIFYKAPTGRALIVYDGLQRLTTLNILLAQLRDGWAGRTDADESTIRACLFEGDRQRLSFPTMGRVLNPLIAGRPVPAYVDKTDSELRALDVAMLIRNTFDSWTDLRRRAFLDFLLSQIFLVVTEVDNSTVAFQMFNGANARGLHLGVGDTLKGLFAEQIRLGGGTVADVEQFTRIWRDAAAAQQRHFDSFLHAVEVLRFRPIERHRTGELLHELFGDSTPAAEILPWFEGEFLRLSHAGKKMRAHLRSEKAEGVDIYLRQLSFLSWSDWLPLYLTIALAHNQRFEAATFENEIRALTRACYIVEVLDFSENARRRLFRDAIDMRQKGGRPFARTGKQRGPLGFGSRSVKTKLRLKLRSPLLSHQKRAALVKWIETLHWGRSVPREISMNATVEHVLPVTAREGWNELFSPKEIEEQTHRLGNLCLLSRDDNEAAGNKTLVDKLAIYKNRKPRTIGCGLVLAKIEEQQAAGRKPWSSTAIEEMTEHLAGIAQKEFGL